MQGYGLVRLGKYIWITWITQIIVKSYWDIGMIGEYMKNIVITELMNDKIMGMGSFICG